MTITEAPPTIAKNTWGFTTREQTVASRKRGQMKKGRLNKLRARLMREAATRRSNGNPQHSQ